MHPILFHIGDTAIHTYGVMSALGFLVIAYLMLRRAKDRGIDSDKIVDLIFWTSLAAIVGARAAYIIANPSQLTSLGEWVNLRTGGLVFYGALLTIIPVGALIIRRNKLPFYAVMDITAAAAPLGHLLSRLGCFAAGCCYGKPTDQPWGVTYAHELAPAAPGIAVHPTQLYEVGYLLLIFIVVNWLYPRKRFDGQIALTYLSLYALLRTANEFLRGDETRGYFLEGILGQTLSTSQGLSLLVATLAIGVFFVAARRARQPGS